MGFAAVKGFLKAALPLLMLDIIPFAAQFVPASAMATSATDAASSVTATLGAQSWTTLVLLALVVVLALTNLKALPFAWHFRIFKALHAHRRPVPREDRAGLLFQPVLMQTATPVTDCDFNMHKSNSTFFADLDLARVHLLGALGFAAAPKGSPQPALGGVACTFRRPVAPLQRVQTYTRVLGWDAKWLYMASWVVVHDPRAARPRVFALQPWRNAPAASAKEAKPPVVCATSIARYVFKQGRKTVPPADVLTQAGLLPPAPADGAPAPVLRVEFPPKLDASIQPLHTTEWSWAVAEEERARGVQVARLLDGLDSLQEELKPAAGPALGEY